MHPAWIDSIPSPVLRDNFIRNYGTYDADEFWFDAVGDLHEAYERPLYSEDQMRGNKLKEYKMGDEFGGLMCWSDPWLIESYEITPAHMKKWWKLLLGCEDLLRGTNRWRMKRGEEPLDVEELCKGVQGVGVGVKHEVEERGEWNWE